MYFEFIKQPITTTSQGIFRRLLGDKDQTPPACSPLQQRIAAPFAERAARTRDQ